MAVIYRLVGITGIYEDRVEWTVACFSDKEKAKQLKFSIEEWVKDNRPKGNDFWSGRWDEWIEFQSKVRNNPYDPLMEIDSNYYSFEIEEHELKT